MCFAMTMSGVAGFALLFAVIVHPNPSWGLNPQEIVETVRHGGVLTYDLDVSKCDVRFPPSLPAYSYGVVLDAVHLVYSQETQWTLYSAMEQPVNGSRFQVENGVWRVTELELRPENLQDGTATLTVNDIEQGDQGKVLANGTISCKMSTEGFRMNAQRRGGAELEREAQVLAALRRGELLIFSADISACVKRSTEGLNPDAADVGGSLSAAAADYWLSPVNGYRIPGNQSTAVEFTSIFMELGQRQVFNVRLQGDTQVQVKVYALTRPPGPPTHVVTYVCTLGPQGSFHIFRL